MKKVASAILAVLGSVGGCTADAAHAIYTNRLNVLTATLAANGVTLDKTVPDAREGAIRIDANGPMTIHLADIQPEGGERVILTYRGHLRTAQLRGRAFLEMRCDTPVNARRVEFAAQAEAVSGSSGWVSQTARCIPADGRPAQHAVLNVVVDGIGTVWVRNIALFEQRLR